MKKFFSSPAAAVLLAVLLIAASSLIGTGLKIRNLTPEEILTYKAQFPGSWLIP